MTKDERIEHERLAIANLADAKSELKEAGFDILAEKVGAIHDEVCAWHEMDSL